MALFRNIEGRFYDIPDTVLACHEVKKEAMDKEFGKKPVVGVQVPRPEAPTNGIEAMGRVPNIIVNQFFGPTMSPTSLPAATLPSDIELAHYGTTIDNPKE
jgi:hypothetical protein